MKKGLVLKRSDKTLSEQDMQLINQYTRRQLSADEVYVFSVVLCDNDIDRDYERFTVEALFELEKLFVGKTAIFDHNPSVSNQTARIFECAVESVQGKVTKTGDEYFRLVARAYMPKSEKNSEFILMLDSGIIKEVSVGCAVKNTLCSICSQDIHSISCNHTKGQQYDGKLCFGELSGVYDAYEFSFVAIPAQRNAGVIKAYSKNEKEFINMEKILSTIRKGAEISLDAAQTKHLCDYITQLEKDAENGRAYTHQLRKTVTSLMGVSQPQLSVDTIKGIVDKLSFEELSQLERAYKSAEHMGDSKPQLVCIKSDSKHKKLSNDQFTI